MPFEYVNKKNAVMNALKDYNTTTATVDLSANLSVRVNNDDILDTDPEITPPRADRMPAVYVTISNKEESGTSIGPTGPSGVKKEALVTFNILAIFGKHGGHSPNSELLDDCYNFARNIEGIFQAEYRLSNTALWCNASTTEFSPTIDLGESFSKAILVTLNAKYFFR